MSLGERQFSETEMQIGSDPVDDLLLEQVFIAKKPQAAVSGRQAAVADVTDEKD